MKQDTPSSSPRSDVHSWSAPYSAAVLILMAAGTALRFLFLTRKPFWFDECFSVEAARLDWSNFLHLLWWREANMSLYYVLLRGWLHLGHSEAFIRSLSVIVAVATLPAMYWLARLLFDRRVALIATSLLTFNAYQIRYAQEARSYALFVFLAVLSSGFFVASVRQPSRRMRFGYALTSSLAVYAHFYALLLVAAHWLALRLLEERSHTADQSRGFAIPPHMRRVWIGISVAVLPLLIFVGRLGAGPLKWIHRPGFQDVLDYYEHMAGNAGAIGLALYVTAIVVALVPIGRKLLAKDAAWDAWRYQFLLVWLVFPAGLTLILSLARPLFYGRYLIFCLPAFEILVAAGLARLQRSWQVAVALSVMVLLSIQGTRSYYDQDFDLDRDGIGAASVYVMDHAESGDGMIFYVPAVRASYEFYRMLRMWNSGSDGPEILFPHHADQLDYRDFTGKPSSEFLRTVPQQHRRVWLVMMYNGTPGNADPTTELIATALDQALPRMERWTFPLVEVRLYSRE